MAQNNPVGGQQTSNQGCHGASTFLFTFYRNTSSATSAPSTSGFRYTNSTRRLTPGSGWSTGFTTPSSTQYTWVLLVRVTEFYSNCAGTAIRSSSVRTGCPYVVPRGQRGCQGTAGRCGTTITPRQFYRTVSNTLTPSQPSNRSFSSLSCANSYVPTSWSATRTNVRQGQRLAIVDAYILTSYSSTNVASYSIRFNCPYFIACPCDGTDGDDGTDGTDGRCGNYSLPRQFYRRITRGASVPSRPTFTTRTSLSCASAYVPSGWSTSRPSLSSNQELAIVDATINVAYNASNRATYSVSFRCPYVIRRGCDGPTGSPGRCGTTVSPRQFYRTVSRTLTPSQPSNRSFTTLSCANAYEPTSWSSTRTTVRQGQRLAIVDAYVITEYSSTNVASYSIRFNCPYFILCPCDGTDGTDGDDGDDGTDGCQGDRYIPYTLYRKTTATASAPSRPSTGSLTRNSANNYSISISGWSTCPPSLGATDRLYTLQAWGQVTYSSSGVDSAVGVCIGCVAEVPRGCRGSQGCPGTHGACSVSRRFYRAVTSGAAVPSQPTSRTFTSVQTGLLFSPSGWSFCTPDLTSSQELAVLDATLSVRYSTSNAATISIVYYCPYVIRRGCDGTDGDDGDDGCDGVRGSEQRQFTLYRAATTKPTKPSTATFTRQSANTYTLTISNWSATPPSLTSTQKLYYVNAWGTVNYNSAGTDSAGSYCIGDVVEVPRGCKGDAGDSGCRGGRYVVYDFYRAATSLPSTPTGTFTRTASETYTPAITGWSRTPPTPTSSQNLYFVQAWGYIQYDASGTDSSGGLCVGCPVLIPAGLPGTQVREIEYYARSATSPSTAGLGFNTSGTFTQTAAARAIWKSCVSDTTGTATLWTVRVVGYLNCTTSGYTASHCIYGPFQTGSQGCQGDPGVHGTDVFTQTFYQAKSGLAPNAPSATYHGRDAATKFTNVGDWATTPPASLGATENLYVTTGSGYTCYSSQNTPSYSACFSTPYLVPRGPCGMPGDTGSCGSQVYIDRRYTRSAATPSITGITFDSTATFSYPSHWVSTLAGTTGTANAWSITVVGTLNYSGSTITPSHCVYGPEPVGSQGAAGDRGVHGTDTQNDLFYRRSATRPTAPTAPSSNTTGWIRTPPTDWFATECAASASMSTGSLYVVWATHTRCYDCDGTSTYSTVYECPTQIPCGDTGSIGPMGIRGSTTEFEVIYTRSATTPSLTGIGFDPATYPTTRFFYPTTWKDTVAATSTLSNPTATLWQAQIVGTLTYDSDGNSTPSHCVFGPVRVGSAGAAGADGVGAYFDVFYRRSATEPPEGPSGAYTAMGPPSDWYRNVTQATDNAANATDPLYLMPANYSGTETCGCVTYDTPILIPSGAKGDPGTSSRTAFIYRRAASPPTVPSFCSSNTATGTWNGCTFIPPTTPDTWYRCDPGGTGNLYIIAAELRNNNTIEYGCLIAIPAQTGGGTSVPTCYPALSILPRELVFDADGNRLACDATLPPIPSTVRTRQHRIVFLWSDDVRNFAETDVTLRAFNTQNLSATLSWDSPRPCSGSIWSATVNLPSNSSGMVEVIVPHLSLIHI